MSSKITPISHNRPRVQAIENARAPGTSRCLKLYATNTATIRIPIIEGNIWDENNISIFTPYSMKIKG
jgi:hypothetical protein